MSSGVNVLNLNYSSSRDNEVIALYKTLSHRSAHRTTSQGYKSGKVVEDPQNILIHTLPRNEVFLRFGTSPTLGLEAPALKRLEQEGKRNTLTPPKTNYIGKLVFYLFGGFNSMMWIAMILSILSWEVFRSKF